MQEIEYDSHLSKIQVINNRSSCYVFTGFARIDHIFTDSEGNVVREPWLHSHIHYLEMRTMKRKIQEGQRSLKDFFLGNDLVERVGLNLFVLMRTVHLLH